MFGCVAKTGVLSIIGVPHNEVDDLNTEEDFEQIFNQPEDDEPKQTDNAKEIGKI